MPKTFQDNMNQTWTLTLSLSKVRTIRDERLNLDLLNPQDYLRLMTSLTDRLSYVYCLCEQQAADLKIGPDDFEERLYGGDFSAKASDALIGECADFTRKLGEKVLSKVADRWLESIKIARDHQAAAVESGDVEKSLDKLMQEMKEMLGLK